MHWRWGADGGLGGLSRRAAEIETGGEQLDSIGPTGADHFVQIGSKLLEAGDGGLFGDRLEEGDEAGFDGGAASQEVGNGLAKVGAEALPGDDRRIRGGQHGDTQMAEEELEVGGECGF